MRKISWQVRFGILLIVISAILYLIHYGIFRDLYHIEIYGLGDIAFLPLEVLLVTLIVDRVITNQEKRVLLQKLNMVIGTFFSDVGTQLLKSISDFDPHIDRIRNALIITNQWSDQDFINASARLKKYEYIIALPQRDPQALDFLEGLRTFLTAKREFLVHLLENPTLLEYESFTDLLWAVTHVAEELAYRGDLRYLPGPDYDHLANDLKRAYSSLILEWLAYMEHLMEKYPYLFSLALRTNPFDPTARPEITSPPSSS
jgi:hypothetical protein